MGIIRLLHFIDWHKGESVYIRKVLDFYLSFLGKGCLGERGKEVNSAQVGRHKGGAWDWRAGVPGGRCSLLP